MIFVICSLNKTDVTLFEFICKNLLSLASTGFINSIEGQIIYENLESYNINGKNFIFNQPHKIVNNEGGIPRVYIRFYGKKKSEKIL